VDFEQPVNRNFTRREFLSVGAMAGAGLVIMSGCGGSRTPQTSGGGAGYSGPSVELDFWNGLTGGDGPYMVKLIERFNSQNENIKVKMSAIEWDVFYQKLPSAISVGRGPQVALMQSFYLPTFAARNIIMPLDDVAQSLGLKASDFTPAVWEAGDYEGQRYGIPLDVWPYGFYFNKEVMKKAGLNPDKPPQTGDEFISALEQLKAEGIAGWWVEPTYPTVNWLFQSLIPQFGGSLFNEDLSEATINADPNLEALTWLTDIVRKGYSPKNVGTDTDDVSFQNNKNAFMWIGPWQINYWKQYKDLEWGVATLPRVGSEKGTWAGSHNFVIPQQRNQDPNELQASKVFINWIGENSAEWAEAGQVPARESVRQTEAFQRLKEQNVFAKELSYVHFSPKLPGFDDIDRNALGPALNQALLLTKEPKAALDEANERANQLLKESRESYEG
jgi:multiple sugar transport system substrate-binding protein